MHCALFNSYTRQDHIKMRSAKPFLLLCTVIVNVGMSKEKPHLTRHGDSRDNPGNIPVVEEEKSVKFVSVYFDAASIAAEEGIGGTLFLNMIFGHTDLCQSEATSAKTWTLT